MRSAVNAVQATCVSTLADQPGDRPVIQARWRHAADPPRTADESAAWRHQRRQREPVDRTPTAAMRLCAALPRARHTSLGRASKDVGSAARVADTSSWASRMVLDVADPKREARDRVVDHLVSHGLRSGDRIVVDRDTATALDRMDGHCTERGGDIEPGVRLSWEAIVAATGRLPRIAIAPLSQIAIGWRPEDQMRIGIFCGYVALMEGLITRMRAEVGRLVTVVATGGLAALFHEHTSVVDRVEPDLTNMGPAMLDRRLSLTPQGN